ncbi:MAG: nucleoside 2-deoxyribosyltransferase domain-containing protein [Agitococcus sp.]|nr:nucleoside 2-deoxyribosyltransferase domain-containing protein [Agitococcus sp.]
MQLIFSDQRLPNSLAHSLFLAGPSPRACDQVDWRHAALNILKSKQFEGTVLIPIPRSLFYGESATDISYDNQIDWECRARELATHLVFWVPRVIDINRSDLGMPAFTTNFELGEDLHSGKLSYGRPSTAVKCKYLDLRVRAEGLVVHESLDTTLLSALTALARLLRSENSMNATAMPRTSSAVLAHALTILSEDIQSEDGVANAAILEGAQRIAELRLLLKQCAPHVFASAEAQHMLDGFNRKPRRLDGLVATLQKELND